MTALADRANVAGVVAAQYAEQVDAEARFPHEALRAMKSERLLGALIPVELGGDGASLSDVAGVCATIAQHCSSSAMMYAMHQIKVSSLVSHGLDSAWHCDFMRAIARDQLLVASATTEGGVGGDLRNSLCAVQRDGDTFQLEKDATVISYAVHADAILVTARRGPEAPSSDQVMVAVRKDQYTLDKTTDWNTLGMRGTCSEGFRLRAAGPVEQILPKPFAEIAAQSMLATSHLLWSSVWYGIANNAVARAQSYVRAEARKKPNVTPPGALRLAEAASMLQLMRSNTLEGLKRFMRAQVSHDELMSVGFAVAMNNIKVGASQAAVDIISHAMMICGIWGYKNGTPYSLGRHLRDALSAPIMINNDRILGNTANLLLVHRIEPQLAA